MRSLPALVLLIPVVRVTMVRAAREEHNLALRFGDAYQAAVLSFSTLSMARPRSWSRTGEPFRHATTSGMYWAASVSCPVACTVVAVLGP